MKLIWLYGPPGVGKLTTAKELSRITGYKVFHNHLTADPVRSIFPRGMEGAEELINKYRIEFIELAARKNVDLIFTFLYLKRLDDAWVRSVVKCVRRYGGEVCFVKIVCSREKLNKRVRDPSRKKFTKIKTLKALNELIRYADPFSSVPYADNFVIDNTNLSPRVVAQKIKKYYKL